MLAALRLVSQPGAVPRGLRRGHPDGLPVHRGELRAVSGGGGAVDVGAAGLRNGVVTTRWPRRADAYADGLRGPARVLDSAPDGAAGLPGLCPTGAISYSAGEGIAAGPGPVHSVRPVRGRPPGRVRLVTGARRGLAGPSRAGHSPGRRERGGTGPGPRGPAPADPGAGPLGAHPARGRGLGRQRGVGDPRPAQPGLRRAPARRLLHREPPARRRAAGHRGGRARDDRAAAPDLRRDAGSRRW